MTDYNLTQAHPRMASGGRGWFAPIPPNRRRIVAAGLRYTI
jgi:hypothetical protein